jgi:hypothetical protein
MPMSQCLADSASSNSSSRLYNHSRAQQPHFRTLVFPVKRRNLSPAAFDVEGGVGAIWNSLL